MLKSPLGNIQNFLIIIITSLERIRNSESEMNNQVQASVQFAKSLVLDPEEEFTQKRTRKQVQESMRILILQPSPSFMHTVTNA